MRRINKSLLALAIAVSFGSPGLAAPKVRRLWSFKGANRTPYSLYLFNGAYYGVIPGSGASGYSSDGSGLPDGAVFQLLPPSAPDGAWTKSIVYAFPNSGYGPNTILAFDGEGNIYGTWGYMVFQLSPPAEPGSPWIYSPLYELATGSAPTYTGLAFSNGALYATLGRGGTETGSILMLAPSASGGAWTTDTLYNFGPEWGPDGANPAGPIVFDASGNLYGTTTAGGNEACYGGCGTAYKLSPPSTPGGAWTETILYSFAGGGDGMQPQGAVWGADGTLYGATLWGGGSTACKDLDVSGCGTIFQLVPPTQAGGAWTEALLYSFSGGSDGSWPVTVLAAPDGSVYGSTKSGGDLQCIYWTYFGCGDVFQLTPPCGAGGFWTKTVLHTFEGTDGWFPAALALDGNGALHGLTMDAAVLGPTSGGDSGNGVVFTLAQPETTGGAWSESVLYGFGEGADGGGPQPVLAIDGSGSIYGVTAWGGSGVCGERDYNFGCGAAFQISPPAATKGKWTESLLYSFAAEDGCCPAGIGIDGMGNLYGTTQPSSLSAGATVFQLSPPPSAGGAWSKSTLYRSSGTDDPLGAFGGQPLIADDLGSAYGTSIGMQGGMVFELSSPGAGGAWTGSVLYTFPGVTLGSLALRGGCLFGIAQSSNAGNNGFAFQLSPPQASGGNWNATILHSFAGGSDGANPNGNLTFDDEGAIYGTTEYGGAPASPCPRKIGCGTVYRISPPQLPGGAWSETVLYSFSGSTDGKDPQGLVFKDGSLYGTATGNINTALYQLTPPTGGAGSWTQTVLYNLGGFIGGAQGGGQALALRAGKIYGALVQDGRKAPQDGFVFEVSF